MVRTEAEVFAFLQLLLHLLREAAPLLRRAKLDVDYMISNVEALNAQAATTNAHQEALKRETQATTKLFTAQKERAYVIASGYLDMAIAAVEKNSDAAKNFRLIRSRMRRAARAEGVPVETVEK